MLKTCTKCNIEKDIEEFHKKTSSKDGHRSDCRSCSSQYSINRREETREYNKKYAIDNIDKIKEYKKEYYLENIEYFRDKNKKASIDLDKEKKKEYQKRYYNKEETKVKVKEYRKKRYNTDILYRLSINIRKRIGESLRSNSINKNVKYETILGCTFLEFKDYISKLFQEGMSWENHGEWHLDHKTPVSWGKCDEDIIRLNHHTNFQPLWKHDNLSKGNRYSS